MQVTHFEAFYTDLFDRENIIDSRFQVFLRNLIASLIANNPAGVFTPQITALTTAYNTYFGNFETKSVNIAERVAKTSSLEEQIRFSGHFLCNARLKRCYGWNANSGAAAP